MSDAYRKKPYLRYCLKIDAKTKYLSGQSVYVSEKLQISRMECRFLESNDVKKFAVKYNIKTNPTVASVNLTQTDFNTKGNRVEDLNEFRKANSFSIDLTNIGNINAIIKGK